MSFIILGGNKRAAFFRKHQIFGSIGENCMIQIKKLPLYSELIFLHNNVRIASKVSFYTHDDIHNMLNCKFKSNRFVEKVGCIEIMDNVFIGAGTKILYNTRIGSNVIIGADSLVNKDIPDNSVYAGVPARYICSFDDYVTKMTNYSERMRDLYKTDMIRAMDHDLAKKIYIEFLRERNVIPD